MEEVFRLNGRETPFTRGETILEAAEAQGVIIPTLCFLKGAGPTGRCGVCVVEVPGKKDLVPACETLVEEGMEVITESRRVISARKEAVRRMLVSGRHNCAALQFTEGDWTETALSLEKNGENSLCPAWGDCMLQDLAFQYQVKVDTRDFPDREYPMEEINPMIIRDLSRCVLCGRCVAACNEIQVNLAIEMDDEKNPTTIRTKTGTTLADSTCVFCGECVQACPVGALIEKKAREKWRPREVEHVRTTCPYCGVGCQQDLHVKDGKIVKVTGWEGAEPNQGRLCVKGRFGYDFIYSEDRLKTPLIREGDGFREAGWDEALDLVANRFRQIISESGPDALAGVSCARSINEDSYQMQKFFRAVIKTNNIDHCART